MGSLPRSIFVAHATPVVPIRHCLLRFFVGIRYRLQLCERNRQAFSTVPACHHKDFGLAFFARPYVNDLYFVLHLQGRAGAMENASGREWELQVFLEVAIPAHRPLLSVVTI